jgi:hypothetical protein
VGLQKLSTNGAMKAGTLNNDTSGFGISILPFF